MIRYFSIALIFLLSCGTAQPINSVELIRINTIQVGNLYGGGEEGFSRSVRVIHSLEEWHNLVKELGKINVFESDFDAHSFDFNKHHLFFCIDNVRSTGGYSLSVPNNVEQKEKTIVKVKINEPNGPAVEVLTQPFLLFSMVKTKNVEVQFIELMN